MAVQRKRSRVVFLRLTPEEYDKLRQRMDAAGMENCNTYLRRVALGEGIQVTNLKEALEEIYDTRIALSRIGNNLNQLARNANAYGDPGGEIPLEELRQEINRLKKELKKLGDDLYSR